MNNIFTDTEQEMIDQQTKIVDETIEYVGLDEFVYAVTDSGLCAYYIEEKPSVACLVGRLFDINIRKGLEESQVGELRGYDTPSYVVSYIYGEGYSDTSEEIAKMFDLVRFEFLKDLQRANDDAQSRVSDNRRNHILGELNLMRDDVLAGAYLE